MKLWIVGKVDPDNYLIWEFQGVFDSKDRAINACRTEWYFIAPAKLNQIQPDESTEWEGAYYPSNESTP